VWPAAGSINSSVCVTPDRMAELTGATWVDVSQAPAGVTDQVASEATAG
jgi:hypothetical protein